MRADRLKAIVKQAESDFKALAEKRGHRATGIFSFGATDIHPRHLAFWLTFADDAGRDRFFEDGAAHAAMRARLVTLGYPEHAVPNVGITAESQETVDRDFQGNWWHAVK